MDKINWIFDEVISEDKSDQSCTCSVYGYTENEERYFEALTQISWDDLKGSIEFGVEPDFTYVIDEVWDVVEKNELTGEIIKNK